MSVAPSDTFRPPSASLTKACWAVVAPGDLPYVTRALADEVSHHRNQRGPAPVAAAYSRILGQLSGQVPPAVSQLSPGASRPGQTGQLGDLEAAVEGMDGSERILLLDWIARTDPSVVAAGFAWLAEYHAANAERRRVDRNRRSTERHRRKRAAVSGEALREVKPSEDLAVLPIPRPVAGRMRDGLRVAHRHDRPVSVPGEATPPPAGD
jgi:hypothetical protein